MSNDPRATAASVFPLSFAQQRLWFFNRLEGPSATYNVPIVARIGGDLDVPALRLALADVVERHEVLRTVFVERDGEPFQQVLPTVGVPLPLTVTEVPADRLDAALRAEAELPFDLDEGPCVRATLLRTAPDRHVLALVLHHIACDGWSVDPLLRDLGSAYEARSGGRAPAWEPLPVQYTDYTLWQRDLLGAAAEPDSLAGRQLAYWRQALADLPEELPLPFDRPRPQTGTFRGHEADFAFSPRVHAELLEIARQTRTTLFMVVQAAVAALLTRLGAGTDIPLGISIAGRTDQALDDLVGLFINTQVLRTDTSGDPTFRELVDRVRETSLDAYSRQDLPFDRLVEELNPVRHRARHPLFQVGLELHSRGREISLGGLDTSVEFMKMSVAKFDLSVVLRDRTAADGTPLGIDGTLEYATDLFDPGTATALTERLVRFLEAAVADPDAPIGAAGIITPAELDLIAEWNSTTRELPDGTIGDLFAHRAALTPDTTALVAGARELTYAELNTWVNRLAHHLIERGVTADSVVAVAMPRTAEAVVAWLAVAKSGGVYTPVDPQNPAERIRQVLADARPAVLVTTEETAAALGPAAGLPPLVTEHRQASAPEHDVTDACRPVPLLPDHAAYVIYTSGSTGLPKGVTVPHRALTNLWAYHADTTFPPPAGPADRVRVALSASLAFDTSWEGVLAMVAGHELHLLDEPTRRDPRLLVDYVTGRGIGQLDVTPSFAAQLLAEGVLDGDRAPRTLMLGGEAVGETLWNDLRKAPRTTVYNYYGPSEFCVEASGCALPEYPAATIGRPVYNTAVHILDEHLNPVPPGVLGEIYLAGANLGRGYLGRAAQTAGRFVANPFGAPGERMYRSGDLGRWTTDGYLIFAGRSDDQVKLRGIRIELGEIQTAVASHAGVADAAVLVREDTPGDKRLVAYLVPAKGATVDLSELRTALGTRLPEYMLPSAFVTLDALPLTRNAKLDRRALPVPDYGSRSAGRAPVTEREKQVAALFAEILKIGTVSLDDNFFELGGHSLLATRLVNRIRTVLGVEVNLMKLFGSPTVAGVVASLADEAPASAAASRPQLVRRGV
ncbi:amino acid adenylation domain-containing protein [Streptomyces sp. NPDC002044]|uniref:non-ribosomal peptide synthetase n=1 Tax=Streptomyces sp. NPDC002044 TaxID=3154662 RepID=UPI0033289811